MNLLTHNNVFMKMDGRRFFSIVLTFLVSLDMSDIIVFLPHSLRHNSFINYHSSDYRTLKDFNGVSCSRNFRLIPFVGAVEFNEQDKIHVPGFLSSGSFSSSSNSLRSSDTSASFDSAWEQLSSRDSSISDSSILSHLQTDSSTENNAEEESGEVEEEEEEESVPVTRTVEPQVLQRLESHFLRLFGMKKRPAKKHVKEMRIPKYLLELYEKQTGKELPTTNLNLPGRLTRTANTVRTFYLEPGVSLPTSNNNLHLKFNLDSIPVSEIVTGAELRVPFELDVNPESPLFVSDLKSVKILLHDIIKPVTPSHSKKPKEFHLKTPISYPIDSKSVDLSKRRNGTSSFWLTFDVFPAVSRWIQEQTQNLDETSSKKRRINHGLLIEIHGLKKTGQIVSHEEIHHGHNLRVKREILDESPRSSENSRSSSETSKNKKTSLPSSSSSVTSAEKGTEVGAVSAVIQPNNERSTQFSPSSNKHPTLFTYSDDGRNGRKVRDAKTLSRHYRAAQNARRRKNHRNKNRKRNLCARHNMFVDFTDVGWNDWIVAPPGYHAYHCSGECPFPMAEHLNATNHAVIQALVHSMNPGLVPPPCCVPTKYSSLSLLYTDSSDKIVLKNYNEMVVDSCGCS